MVQRWPTRYKCRKCTRATSIYPIFCSTSGCPIKRDWLQDNLFGLVVIFIIIIYALSTAKLEFYYG